MKQQWLVAIGAAVLLAAGIGGWVWYTNQAPVPEEKKEMTACRPTGCSGQVCSDEDVITTCEYSPEYACYTGAACERQANGDCGWTETADLRLCLDAVIKS